MKKTPDTNIDQTENRRKGGLKKKLTVRFLLLTLAGILAFSLISFVLMRWLSGWIRSTDAEQVRMINELAGNSSDTKEIEKLDKLCENAAARMEDYLIEDIRDLERMAAYCEVIAENIGVISKNKLVTFPSPESEENNVAVPLLTPDGSTDPALLRDPSIYAYSYAFSVLDNEFLAPEESIAIAFPNGACLIRDIHPERKLTEDGKPVPYDAREEVWYRKAAAHPYVGNYFTIDKDATFSDKSQLEISIPVFNKDGSLLLVLCGSRNLESIKACEDLYDPDMEGDEEAMMLLDQNGRLLASSKETGALSAEQELGEDLRREQENPGSFNEIRVAMEDREGGGGSIVHMDGKEDYLTHYPILFLGWTQLYLTEFDNISQKAQDLLNDIRQTTEKNGEEVRSAFTTMAFFFVLTAVLLFALALFWSIRTANRITRPIRRFTEKLGEISGESIVFQMEPIFETGDEIQTLAMEFNQTTLQVKKQVQEIIRMTEQKNRLKAELNVAAEIQASMLPTDFPLFPNRKEFSLYASMDPAKEVGGDFYDAFLIDEDHLALVVADVSGKGIPAALFMAVSKTMIMTRARHGGTPAHILMDVNNALIPSNKAGMFVTVWMGILTISTGELIETNAGHEKPALCREGDGYELVRTKHGLMVGTIEGAPYGDDTLVLAPGDTLFVYTDGLPEANNADGKLFRSERMLRALNKHCELPPEVLLPAVRREVDEFVGDAEQFDDLTMLAIRYEGGAE